MRSQQDAAGHPDDDGDGKAGADATERDEEIDRQIAGPRELHDAFPHPIRPRQDVRLRGQRKQPPHREQQKRQRQALQYHRNTHAPAGVGKARGAHGFCFAFSYGSVTNRLSGTFPSMVPLARKISAIALKVATSAGSIEAV